MDNGATPTTTTRRGRALLSSALSLTALALVLTSPAYAERVGIAGAVNPSAFAVSPQGERRTLQAGQDVQFRERIVTDAGGQTQIMFLDRSAVTVGPSAELTIDEFVYNPQSRSGSLGLNVASGAVRFVGGALSKQGGVSVRTPVATIGIRGGIASVNHNAVNNQTSVTAGFGQVTVQTGTGAPIVVPPGFQTTVTAPPAVGGPNAPAATPGGSGGGAPTITPPTRATPQVLATVLSSFEGSASGGSGGGSGGGTATQTTPRVTNQQVNTAISSTSGTTSSTPTPPSTPSVPVTPRTTTVPPVAATPTPIPPSVQNTVQTTVQQTTQRPTVPPPPPVVTPPPPVVTPPPPVVTPPPPVVTPPPPVVTPPPPVVTPPPPVVAPSPPPPPPALPTITVPTAPSIPAAPSVPTRP
ncbi:MAG: FecR domain-containing protein [Alphaproteobacteria bacterium]|nr:FecR domain-containing protein [Alphaproteobacteria bacterium]